MTTTRARATTSSLFGFLHGQGDLWVVTTALKVLLFSAYKSTDFEVHRNWLAITHHLPLKKWYHDTTSEWTLDYPPFFAYFSYILTLPAHLLPFKYRDHLLELSSIPIDGWDVIGYMRTSVLLSELVLFAGLLRLSRSTPDQGIAKIISSAIAFHPGFLILDAVHFQYNGFLFGIMIWSLVGAKEGKPLMCAAFFAALLNFKHIYIYFAPAWFVYLLRAYCMPSKSNITLRLVPLLQIGAVTAIVFAISLGPFIWLGQGQQLLSRLFPFTRGLMHAYWAPNAWAGVTLLDRILIQVSKRLHLNFGISSDGIASASRGLVGDTHFAILPNISPLHCFILTGVSQIIQLIPPWRRPSYRTFLQSIAACGFSSFMFGWHVHEKAVMLILVPLSLLAAEDWDHFQAFTVSSVSGIVSLFPLLFKAAETPVKMGYSFIWTILVTQSLRKSVSKSPPTVLSFTLDLVQTVYLCSAPLLLIFTSFLHPGLTLRGSIPVTLKFLPLMTTSVWCSFGMWLAWVRLGMAMFRSSNGGVELKIE